MIKKLQTRCINYFSVLLLFLAFGMNGLLAQDYVDDPNFDHIPPWYFDTIQNSEKTPSQVITINYYDNYKLGVDFAEPHISMNPNEPTQFFTAYNTDESYRTSDGHDWSTTNPSWGTSVNGDPVTAYDSLGNLYYENMYGGIQGCKVVKSTNNGQTWSAAVTAISGVDKNWIAADQTSGPYANYVYSVMTSNSGGNFSRSTNQGASWSNTWTASTQSLPGMMVCVGPYNDIQGGAVYVVTNGGSAFASNYVFYRSLNGGATFQLMSSKYFSGYVGSNVNGRNTVENMRTRPYPFITADNSYGPNRGRLHLVYASNDPPGNGNKPDIWNRYSDDGGVTWSDANRVNDDVNTQSNNQWAPATWCDKNTGRLYIHWMDTRDTPTSDSALMYATYSDDGGETFVQNHMLSNQKMKINCTTCGGGGTPRYQGDYTGITSNEKVSISSWTDFRSGNFSSFTGYFPDFALRIYPTELELAGTDTIWAVIPDVKAYNDTAMFIATVEDPPSGDFIISYPEGNYLTSFPDSLPIVITADNVPLGEYSFYLTGMGTNGTPVHKRTSSIVLDELPLPIVDFLASDSMICTSSSVDFTDLTQFSPTQWFWEFQGGNPATSTDQNPMGIVYETTGTFDVKLYAINGTGATELTKNGFITVSDVPATPEGENVYACLPGVIPALEVIGENITWYDDPELLTMVATGNVFETGETEPGMYTYYAIAETNGCESLPLEVSLNINNKPEATFEPLASVCDNEPEFTLTGGLPEGGEYMGPGVSGNMFMASIAGAGVHNIGYIYTDENFCSDTAYQDIIVSASPVFDLGADTSVCANLTYTLDATATDVASYLWSPGGETTAMITVDTTGMGLGTGEYSVTVTGNNGCISNGSAMVTFYDCTGVNEISGLQSVTIVPNPNDGVFSVQFVTNKPKNVDIQILSASGQGYYKEGNIQIDGTAHHDIRMEGINPGIYYLVISAKEGKVVQKFLVR